MEELVEEDPNKTLSNETSIFAHADNCKALLQQVPQTFYFGTTIVGLTCMDVSDEYFAFGSDCGALFIFNRRINRPVTPLRTNYDEVVTCVRLFSGENSMMATGHKSGSIVLIRFPSGQPASRRKMEQTKLSECHKGHRINCVEWTNDASKLFSADESGMIVVTQIDFDNHLFQPSFVCNEGFSVSCISYAFSRLAVRSTHRVTVVNVASASTALDISASIDEPTNDHCGILLCDQFTNPTLFISSQSGVLYNFNALTGELRARNNLQQEINDKVGCACFLGSNEEDSKSTDEEEEVLMRLYALGDSRVLFFFKRHAVVVSVAEENVRLMDVRCLREMQMLHNSELREISVDRWSQPVALFVLTGDKRATRFSSVAAPDYLTVASEPVEEFGARTLISSLQKTTKLLPYAPTGAILNRLKANGEIHGLPTLPSLPIPLFSNIMRSSGDLSRKNSQISLDGDSSGTETHRGDTALTADGLREGCGSDRYEAAEGDFTVGQAYTALKTVSDGKVVHNEAVKRGGSSEEQQVVLDWGRPQPNRLLDSAENGYFAMQTSPVSVAPSVASDSLPYEQFGMLEEVTVRRTKKAPGRKKKSASDEDNATRRFDSLPSYTEDFSSIDEETLSDILKALLGAPQSSVNRASADELEEEENNVNAHVPDVNREPTPQASISSSAEGAVPSQRASDSEDLEERETPELNKADAEKEAPGKEAPVRDANEQECNAYMQLMKRALMNKSAHFAGSQQSLEVFDEETFVEKIIVNDRGDIWNEMELPYSCVSFSVSSQYIVICHAKKKKKPRYMSIPSVSEGQWVPIKQDAEVIETNGKP
ncbi:WD repeat-containing protein [Toxocara canis]|uniref:WD repeat-containing protein n=1 Tax=Toxocara canis TaxID=6265 RepID=A0A0B2VY81_TOXCA|nr:WD repeat-containing protein [Toxocara canis]